MNLKIVLPIIFVAMVAVLFWFMRGSDAPPGSGLGGNPGVPAREVAGGTGGDTTSVPTSEPTPAVADVAPDTVVDATPANLIGRVLGEGQGVAGASVLLFSVSELEALIFRLERIVTSVGEIPRVPELIQTVRNELGKLKSSALIVTTDDKGEFVVRTERRGGQFVLVYAREWLFKFGDVVNLEDGNTAELIVSLERGAQISGRVVGAGREPLAGIRVLAEYRPAGTAGVARLVRRALRWINGEFLKGPFETTTGAVGEFAITALPAGTYDLLAYDASGIESYLPSVETGSSANVIYFGVGARVSGALADNFGAPLGGIVVQLERIDDALSLPPMAAQFSEVAQLVNRYLGDPPVRVKSGDDGTFTFHPLGTGSYKLSIDEAGFYPARKNVTLDWNENVALGVIELNRGLTIRGIVRAASGEPLENAEVLANVQDTTFFNAGSVVSDFLTGRVRTVTHADGTFVLSGLRKGKYDLVATLAEFGSAHKRAVEPEGTAIELVLTEGQTLSGRVLSIGGEPIAHARVKMGSAVAETNVAGEFELRGISADGGSSFGFGIGMARVRATSESIDGETETGPTKVALEASAKGYHSENIEFELEKLPATVDVELEVAPEITGIVLSPTGEPAAGALVRIVPKIDEEEDFLGIGAAGLIFLGVTTTGIDGRFRFRSYHVAEGGEFQIIADHLLYSRGTSEPFRFGELLAEPRDVELRLVTMSRIEGVVTDGAQPVAGAIVRLVKPREDSHEVAMAMSMFGLPKPGKTTHSDSNGHYVFEKELSGTYEVSAEKVGFKDSTEQTLTLAEGQTGRADFILDAGGVIEGIVVDEAGRTIADAAVRILRESDSREIVEMQRALGSGYRSAQSGANGQFRFEGLPEDTYYIVIARAKGYSATEQASVRTGGPSVRVALVPAADLRGVVLDAATQQPIEEFNVQVQSTSGDDSVEDMIEFGGRQIVDAGGVFERRDVAAGKYTITLRAAGYATQSTEISIAPGSLNDRVFTLGRAGSLRGRVTNERDEPVANVRVVAKTMKRADGVDSDEAAIRRHWSDSMLGESGTTDQDGRYVISTYPDGPCRVEFSHDDYNTETRDDITVARGSELELNLKLAPGLVCEGIVTSRADGGPTQRMLFVRGLDAENKHVQKSEMSDENGNFRFAGLVPGRYRLVGLGSSEEGGQPLELELKEDRKDIRFELP
ncbi:MAG: carboxypeptidase regulatory-like domain-containing protein [Planctomycetota bacterium]